MKGRVWLYQEPAAEALETGLLAAYLREKLPGWNIEERTAFAPEVALEAQARAWAEAKVRHLNRPWEPFPPLPGELAYEGRRLTRSSSVYGVLYDGLILQERFRSWLPPNERARSHIHILFTQQLIGTFDPQDRRYHARVMVGGIPSLISITGLVEAPAKPREYYLIQQQYQAWGRGEMAEAQLREELAGRFLEPGDPRTNEVLKGYVLQAIFHQILGEAFCEDPNCRLFNAHWQEEMLQAQRDTPYDLCPHHSLQLRERG